MHTIRKHVEDPLVHKTNKVIKPITISVAISIVHVGIINGLFTVGRQDPLTCAVVNFKANHWDEMINMLLILLVPILIKNVLELRKYMDGTMSMVLNPFIIKQNIVAMNQIVQVVIEFINQLMQMVAPKSRNVRYFKEF